MKRNIPVLTLAIVYILIACAILLIAKMLYGCTSSVNVIEQNPILIARWETDANKVYIQYKQSTYWVTQRIVPPSGSTEFEKMGDMYRIMVVKDSDTAFSNIVYIR